MPKNFAVCLSGCSLSLFVLNICWLIPAVGLDFRGCQWGKSFGKFQFDSEFNKGHSQLISKSACHLLDI